MNPQCSACVDDETEVPIGDVAAGSDSTRTFKKVRLPLDIRISDRPECTNWICAFGLCASFRW